MPAIRLESKFILASLCSFLEDRGVREVFEVLDLIQEHKCWKLACILTQNSAVEYAFLYTFMWSI